LISKSTSSAQTEQPDLKAELDSLYSIWEDKTQTDSIRIDACRLYIRKKYLFSDPLEAFNQADILIKYADEHNNNFARACALRLKGISLDLRGELLKSLDYHFEAIKYQKEVNDLHGVAGSFQSIGLIYESEGQYDKALEYQKESLKIREQIGYLKGVSSCYNNIGSIYSSIGKLDESNDYHRRALTIQEEMGNDYGVSISFLNLGYNYDLMDDVENALAYYIKALNIQERTRNMVDQSMTLFNIGYIYLDQGKHQEAIKTCLRSYHIGVLTSGLLDQRDACSCLYQSYKSIGKTAEALEYLEKYNILDDSLNNEAINDKFQKIEFEKQLFEDSIAKENQTRLLEYAHQEEVKEKNRTRNIVVVLGIFALLLAAGFYSRSYHMKRSKAVLQTEKDRSEELLLNILPADIAAELKEKGKADARDFENVSILFSDFKGFTETSSKLSAQGLVTEINTCFEAFDKIMDKHGIEKIKTIGDAYMAAGGLPVQSDDSLKNTVLAALEMQDFIGKRKVEMDAANKPAFEMRVGIHTGPIVAGIVGLKKFQYDVWGDTVNTASRMESSAEVGKVNISQTTYELLKDDKQFTFVSRGKIKAKGKGEIEMYFVSRLK